MRAAQSKVTSALFGLVACGMAGSAHAKIPQTTAGNPPAALAPRATDTGHEIGVGTHLHTSPGIALLPRFRYRYQFARTAAQGILSGLWLEAAIGPAIFFPDVDGNAAFNLGYEFDPFSNLALTFSPVFRNDFFFDAGDFDYAQTFGLSVRLYIKGNWVFFVNPAAFGWHADDDGCCGFAYQGGAGFGYKF